MALPNKTACKRCGISNELTDLESLKILLTDKDDIKIEEGGITVTFDYCLECGTKNDRKFPGINVSQAIKHTLH